MKYKTYTFRAYPNKTQANLFYLTFLMCRIMFNTLLKIVLDNFSKYNSEVEYCLENVDNRFELVMLASKRARQLATGGQEPKVPLENDKPTVLALREIAEGLVDKEIVAAEEAMMDEQPIFAAFDTER